METDGGHLQNPTVDTILKGCLRQSLLRNKTLSTRWLQGQRSTSLLWRLTCRVQVLVELVLLWGLSPLLVVIFSLSLHLVFLSPQTHLRPDFSSINVCHTGFWSNRINQFSLNLLSKGFLSKLSHPETLRIRILAWESRLQGTQFTMSVLKDNAHPPRKDYAGTLLSTLLSDSSHLEGTEWKTTGWEGKIENDLYPWVIWWTVRKTQSCWNSRCVSKFEKMKPHNSRECLYTNNEKLEMFNVFTIA